MTHDESKTRQRMLTDEILERVREIAQLRVEAESHFIPGKSPIRYAGRVYDEHEMVNLVESALEFWLTAGRWHRKLETLLAKWYGLKYARLTNSGSSANLLAITALTSPFLGDRRLGPGDEVITVAAGFPTTVTPILQNSLVPVFVDISAPTYNIDVTLLEEALSSRTRAVMIAHTLGNPFDLDAVSAFCRKHDLYLVEDNCDAAGSLYRNRKTGTFGTLATLSFYPAHHMTTGEGGAVLCNDDVFNRSLESLRDWGRDCWCQPGVDNTCGKRFEWQLGDLPSGYDHKYTYSTLGYNLKMTDLQASVGVAQVAKLDRFGAARRANWARLRSAFKMQEDFFETAAPTEGADPSWFGFVFAVRPEAPFTRDELVHYLELKKIQTRMLFSGNVVRQPALVDVARERARRGLPAPFRVASSLVATDAAMERAMWIGLHPGMSEVMLGVMIEEISAFVRTRTGHSRVG